MRPIYPLVVPFRRKLMFVSRRKFIRIGAIAALAAGVPLKSSIVSFAQKISSAGTDPLSLYTQATFTQYLNSVFRLHGSRIVDVTLMKVTDTFPTKAVRAAGQESFTLLFRGGSKIGRASCRERGE